VSAGGTAQDILLGQVKLRARVCHLWSLELVW